MNEVISIKNAVLHVLDSNINVPVLSDRELELDGEIHDFLAKHVEKILNDGNLKNARFSSDSSKTLGLCRLLGSDTGNFLQVSRDTAVVLFDIMVKNVDISPADLVCILFSCDGRLCFGILKLNYKSGFTHFVQNEEDGNSNIIIRHRTLLPSEVQKVDEGVLINLDDFSIKLIEKEYEINGEKGCYMSTLFLDCSCDLSDNAKLKILDRAAKKINKKYFDEDFDKAAKLKKAVSESLEETSAIQVDELAEAVFEKNIEVRNEYLTEVQKAGLTERSVSIPESLAVKKFRTHRIKTDTGIEINFPLDFYDDREKIEFVNNADGTISIVIKNVGRIMNK